MCVRGFSLIELVIVIVILAILAAIALPQIGWGLTGAGEAALSSSLQTMSWAIEMYAAEHRGTFPGSSGDGSNPPNSAKAFENQLTMYSDAWGRVAKAKDTIHIFGPYLAHGIPPMPVGKNAGSNTVLIDFGGAMPTSMPGSIGWVYNPMTGKIVANGGDGQKTSDLSPPSGVPDGSIVPIK